MKFLKSERQTLFKKLFVLGITTLLFIVGFVLNITSYNSLFDYNQQAVSKLQSSTGFGSNGFITFMNIISLLFDPGICTIYILVMYLITSRKLQIIGFLLWFFLLSWLNQLLKLTLHQPRPFWIPGGEVQMLSWTCYTDYGSPSGHAMLAIVLLQFFLRFFTKANQFCNSYIWIGYILIFIIQILVMFSRVILGMHSINQVLYGLLIGIYSFIPYYLFIQGFIFKIILFIFRHQKYLLTNLVVIITALALFAIQLPIALVPKYDTLWYAIIIQSNSQCKNFQQYSSFQYACLGGTSIISAGFAIIISFNYIPDPDHFYKSLNYSRFTSKFLIKFLLMIFIPAIPLIFFLNPLWKDVEKKCSTDNGKAALQWVLYNVAIFLAIVFLLLIYPLAGKRLQLQHYENPLIFLQQQQLKAIEGGNIEFTTVRNPSRKQSQLTTPDV